MSCPDKPSLLKLFLFTNLIFIPFSAYTQDQSSASVVQAESVARMEKMLLLKQSLDEGNKLLGANELTKARMRFQSIIENTMPGGPTSAVHNEAKLALGSINALLAGEAEAKGDKEAALRYWTEAVSAVPSNSEYRAKVNELQQEDLSLQEQFQGSTAATPELVEKVSEVQRLIFEGDRFMETGQLDRAVNRYKKVLLIDPYNKTALRRVIKAEDEKITAINLRYHAEREKAFYEVQKGWNIEVTRSVREQSAVEVQGNQQVEDNAIVIENKLESIIIPEITFTEIDVSDAIEYLARQSRDADSEGRGINFVLKTDPTFIGSAEGGAEAPPSNVNKTVSLDIKGAPLLQILEYIMTLTNLQYKIEEHAVFIFPNNETNEVMSVRSYSVPPNFFNTPLTTTDVTIGATTARTVEVASIDVKQELESNGVQFSLGAKATYLPRAAKLIVKNTLDQLNLIDQLLARQDPNSKQIEVEAKFIQFKEDSLKDLSFTYQALVDGMPNPFDLFFTEDRGSFDQNTNEFLTDPANEFADPSGVTTGGFSADGSTAPNFAIDRAQTVDINGTALEVAKGGVATAGLRSTAGLDNDGIDDLLGQTLSSRSSNTFSFSGIIAESGFRALISAIETNLGSDLMAAPRVTLISGERSKIDIARKMLYPTEYEAPEPLQTNNNRSVVTRIPEPGGPLAFESRSIGIILDVKATANSDRTIDLELKPIVSEFDGFINYGGDVSSANPVDANNPFVIFDAVAIQPVFTVRSVETQVKVVDGQTVVMGGFIRDDVEEIEDRVPFFGDLPLIGRLFRSQTTRDVKSNLTLFVTARLVNPDGTPEFLTETEEELFISN
ncbi:MAG: hypothetical protein AAGA18_02270 [Verrucomicrobiota bacterium]